MDAWAGLSADLIERFVEVSTCQRQLPRRTRRCYRSVLCTLDLWVQGARGYTLVNASAADLRAYCRSRVTAGVGSRILDRLLAGIKSFYAYVRESGCRDDDPADGLEGWIRSDPVCAVAAHRVLKEELRRAFGERCLQVYYQPKFHLATGGLRGVEALLRWRTRRGEWIAPAVFVPMLEEMDLIGEVGTWLFERAAADSAWWRERDLDIARVAINVSPLQLRCQDFLTWVLSICDSWNSRGTGIDIELTESTLMPDPGCMTHVMDALTASNVRFALDDFGMGYSSLDLLLKLPVRYLKIDRSFVGHMLVNRKAAMLVEAIIRMAHEIGLEAIAEGVETEAQLRHLAVLGCDIGQGHYFHPALDRETLLQRLGPGVPVCAPPPPRNHFRGPTCLPMPLVVS